MAEWWDSGMAEWWDGGMTEGRNGRMVFYYIPNLSCYIYGTCQRRQWRRRRQQHQRLLNHVDVLMYSNWNCLLFNWVLSWWGCVTLYIVLHCSQTIYKFSQPPGSYVQTCTSFYIFSGPNRLSGWVGYWTPTQLHHHLPPSHHPMPPPRHHYLWHTIGNSCVSWFGAFRPARQARVPFLNDAKLKHL